jgi:hypothetical protein
VRQRPDLCHAVAPRAVTTGTLTLATNTVGTSKRWFTKSRRGRTEREVIQGTGTRRSRSVLPFPKRRFNHEWTLIDTNRRTTDDTDWQEGTGRALLGICGSPGRESRFQRWWFSDFDNHGALHQGSTETAALALTTPAKTTWSAAADAPQHSCSFACHAVASRAGGWLSPKKS